MAVTQGTMVKSFVSAIDFLDQRDIDPNIYDQSRDRAFTDIMKMVNRTKPAKMFFYNNFVNNDVYEVANVASVTSGSGSPTVVFVINSATTFPRVGDLIKTSNAANIGKQALVTAVSGTSITVQSVDNSNFTVAASDKVQFGSNAFPEQSGSPKNRRYGLTKYFNNIQIFREVDEISDVQKVAKIEVNVGGDYHILPYQTVQKVIKLNGDISVQMLAGTASASSLVGTPYTNNTLFTNAAPGAATPTLTATDGAGNTGIPVQTTGGLDWYCINYGINDSASTLGTFGFVELDEIIDNFIANKAPTDMMVFMGSRAYRLISKFLKQLGSSSVDSRRLNVDGKSFDFNVEHLSYGGYEFDFVHVPIFDHPQLFSATLVADVNGSMYFVPKDQVDTVDNGRQPRMQIRYTPTPFMGSAANKSSNGMITEWRTGALAEIPTSSTMQLHTDWETAQGLECLAVKHFQKYRVI
jgi:hypothetical protein